MYPDYECGDYDPEFDHYVHDQIALRNCEHSDAWQILTDYEGNQQREACFCPNCGEKVTYESLCPKYHDDWAETRAEIAAETAFENKLMGIREY